MNLRQRTSTSIDRILLALCGASGGRRRDDSGSAETGVPSRATTVARRLKPWKRTTQLVLRGSGRRSGPSAVRSQLREAYPRRRLPRPAPDRDPQMALQINVPDIPRGTCCRRRLVAEPTLVTPGAPLPPLDGTLPCQATSARRKVMKRRLSTPTASRRSRVGCTAGGPQSADHVDVTLPFAP
jgi:hypothetical protein